MKWLQEKKEFGSLPEGPDPRILDTFPNPGVTSVTLRCKEFTSLCPLTGQPDWAEFEITYHPVEKCLESKSLKMYLATYRNFKGFAETITTQIGTHLHEVLAPTKGIEVRGFFTSRGGISINPVFWMPGDVL